MGVWICGLLTRSAKHARFTYFSFLTTSVSSKGIRIGALLALDTVFFLLEVIVGYSVGSLALIADSFHMLNDIISLIIALWAVRVKNNKPADGRYTYGWQRAEILGALINAVFLLALCFTIIIEAIQRFVSPPEISLPKLVLGVGIAGLLSNILGLVLFHEHGHSHSHGSPGRDVESGEHSHSHGDEEAVSRQESEADLRSYFPDNVVRHYSESTPLINEDHAKLHKKKKKSMNMEGVFLHVLGDALGNVGVIITALFIWKTNYSWRFYSDPLVSLVITAIIFSSALPLCRRSSKILLQATPTDVNSNLVVEKIVSLPCVKSIHDFHVWNLNEDILIASLHLELNDTETENLSNEEQQINKPAFVQAVAQVREILHAYGIHSATIQPEFSDLRTGQQALTKRPSAYGATNKSSCVLDDVSGCDPDCLK